MTFFVLVWMLLMVSDRGRWLHFQPLSRPALFLAHHQYFLVRKVHPSVVIDQAVQFAFLVQVSARVVLVFEARACQCEAVQFHFGRFAREHGQYLAVSMQIAIYFGHRVAGVAARRRAVGVFAGQRAKFFVAAAPCLLTAVEAVFFHGAKVVNRFYSIVSVVSDDYRFIIRYNRLSFIKR